MEIQRPRRTFGEAHRAWVIVPVLCISAVLAGMVISAANAPAEPPAVAATPAGSNDAPALPRGEDGTYTYPLDHVQAF